MTARIRKNGGFYWGLGLLPPADLLPHRFT
jgi:hypothetical protein